MEEEFDPLEEYKGSTLKEIIREIESKTIKELTLKDVLLYEALIGRFR